MAGKVALPTRGSTAAPARATAFDGIAPDAMINDIFRAETNAVGIASSLLSLRQNNKAEAELWALWRAVLTECARPPRTEDAAVPPHRRWATPQSTLLQAFLGHSTPFRFMNVVMRWLEATAATNETPVPVASLDAARRQAFAFLRCGEVAKAVQCATANKDHVVAAVITATQVISKPDDSEEHIPLFGEYGHSESSIEADQSHRLKLLSHLRRKKQQTQNDSEAFLHGIEGTLAGTAECSLPFGNTPNWRDDLWATLRQILVPVYACCVIRGGRDAPPGFAAEVELACGIRHNTDDWVRDAVDAALPRINQLLQRALLAHDGDYHTSMLIRSLQCLFTDSVEPITLVKAPAQLRTTTALLRTVDAAHRQGIVHWNVQRYQGYEVVVTQYAEELISNAELAKLESILDHVVRMALAFSEDKARVAILTASARNLRQKLVSVGCQQVDRERFEQRLVTLIGEHGARQLQDPQLANRVLRSLSKASGSSSHSARSDAFNWLSLATGEKETVRICEAAVASLAEIWRTEEAFDSMTNIVTDLRSRVLATSSPQDAVVARKTEFWCSFVDAVRLSDDHSRLVLRCADTAAAPGRKGALFELRRELSHVHGQMFSAARCALENSICAPSAAVHMLCRVFDAVTLEIPNAGENETTSLFQEAMGLIAHADGAGLFDDRLAAEDAAQLFKATRVMRACLGA